MLNKTMILPTVRPDMFMALLDSWIQCPQLDDWNMLVYFQCYSDEDLQRVFDHPAGSRISNYMLSAERKPPYLCRAELYENFPDVDIYASLDDDMEFWPERVDYDTAVRMALDPGAGVVSCNWVRVKSEALIARARYEPGLFLPQLLVNMSGGQIYTRAVAETVFKYPIEPYLFCDIQLALCAYLEGYVNYRYLGSMIFHKVMAVDGLQVMFAQRDMALPDPQYLGVIPAKGTKREINNYHMPDSSLLTPLAHAKHHFNRRKLLDGRK